MRTRKTGSERWRGNPLVNYKAKGCSEDYFPLKEQLQFYYSCKQEGKAFLLVVKKNKSCTTVMYQACACAHAYASSRGSGRVELRECFATAHKMIRKKPAFVFLKISFSKLGHELHQ